MRLIFFTMILFLVGSCKNEVKTPESQAVDDTPIAQNVEPDTITTEDSPKVEFDPSLYSIEDGAIIIDWKFLSKVNFREEYHNESDTYIPYPIFHDNIKAIDGKQVRISGYVIPVEETGEGNIIVLSAFPFSNCFFCGGAGPESVMDIKLKGKPRRFQTDDKITFQGKLHLNDTDLFYLNYILEEAEMVKE